MSTKRQLREQEEERNAKSKAGQRLGFMRWSYLAVCLLLLVAVFLSLKPTLFLLKNSRNEKNIGTGLESYTPWPAEVREAFQKMLLQNGGRIKPANTFARFTLLQINNGTRVKFETRDGESHSIKADEWLLDSLFRGDIAKELPIFNVDDTDAIADLGVEPKPGDSVHRKRDRYSYNQLLPVRSKLAAESSRIAEKKEAYDNGDGDPSQQPDHKEVQLLRLSRNISLFEYLVGQFSAVRKGENMVNTDLIPEHLQQIATRLDMGEFLDLMPEMTPQQLLGVLRQPGDTEEARLLQAPFQLFFFYANSGRNIVIIPPKDRLREEWKGIGDAMLTAMQDKDLREWAKTYLKKLSDLHEGQKAMFAGLAGLEDGGDKAARAAIIKPAAERFSDFVRIQKEETQARFEARLADLDRQIEEATEPLEVERLEHRKEITKKEGATTDKEVKLYNSGYFHSSLAYFILGFLILSVSWFRPGTRFSKYVSWVAAGFIILALGYDIAGIVQRCVIRNRPPITNLYDTVIFITAAAVLLALLLEFFTRRGVGLVVAAVGGMLGMFLSLRYEVKEATDTMDPLQAVLDTNFWLATHVTTINIGYAAGLLAMLLGAYYLIHRFLRPFPRVLRSVMGKEEIGEEGIFHEDKKTRDFFKSIAKMTYGIVCFGLLFSIVGTVLGGVWANYSWGRFWGWDPKENGALMICLWSLVILHGRMGGFIRDIGIAVNSVFLGMIVTFSWWGVNNLGIGLHSYGFTEGVWEALFISWIISILIMACAIPISLHERFKRTGKKPTQSKEEAAPGQLEESPA